MSRFDDTPVGGDAHGRPYLVHAPRSLDLDRARGALLGLAVGDALGTTLEFTTPEAAPFSPPLSGPHTDITGGGPFRVAPGQVTDDTQMATVLARSLMTHGGFVADALAVGYVEWGRVAFDVGHQTRAALELVAAGVPAAEVGRRVWLDTGRRAAGNGSLMRTAPLALFYPTDGPRRRAVAMAESALTHYDPRCQLACAAYDGALAASVRGSAKTPAAMIAVACEELAAAHGALRAEAAADAPEIDAALAALSADLDAAQRDDPALYSSEVHLEQMAGFVRVAFRLAFWQLAHARSFEAALIDVVNRGGDADTNGAITGALLGAYYGAAQIPESWRVRVLNALDGAAGPWATEYHPRRLLELLPTERSA